MVGVGGYVAQEKLRFPTPAVSNEGRQQGCCSGCGPPAGGRREHRAGIILQEGTLLIAVTVRVLETW